MLPACFSFVCVATAQTQRASFDVVSVKPAAPDAPLAMRLQPGGRYIASGITAKSLIANAYGVPEDRVVDGPHWLDLDRFVVEGKAAGPLPPWPASNDIVSQMLQSMLEDRFRFRGHQEDRDTVLYNLVIAKGGVKIQASTSTEAPLFSVDREKGVIRSRGVPIRYLANNLLSVLGRPVTDKTGLSGNYEYTLTFSPIPRPASAYDSGVSSTDTEGSDRRSIFSVLQDQLGLRLETSHGKVQAMVVDSIDRPGDN
jgi:uncharacterized protein (TIGR03435 family)